MADMTQDDHIKAIEKYRDGILSGGVSVPYDDLMNALDAAIAALRCLETCTLSETNNSHIEKATEPTMTQKAQKEYLSFVDEFMGILGFIRKVADAETGSETAPNTVSPNGSPVLGDNTNGIKPGSVTNQPKTTDWKPRKWRIDDRKSISETDSHDPNRSLCLYRL